MFFHVTIDGRVTNSMPESDGRPKRVDRRKFGQHSLTVEELCLQAVATCKERRTVAIFLSGVQDRVWGESTLIFQMLEFPYNTAYNRSKEALVPQTSSIRPDVSRLMPSFKFYENPFES